MDAPRAGVTVLVVDDDPALRLLCRVNLELEGYGVLEAPTLEAAADTVATVPVDVILLDVHVGTGDGRVFLRELRDAENTIPVIFFTGSSALEDEDQELADGILPKPFQLEELIGAVRSVIGSIDSRT
jgi:DNA-binding response OmpR family regulator